MRAAMIAILLAAPPAIAAQPPVSGSTSPASRGGAGPVDPAPGSSSPTPTIVGGSGSRGTGSDASVQVTRDTRCTDTGRGRGARSGAAPRYRCYGTAPRR